LFGVGWASTRIAATLARPWEVERYWHKTDNVVPVWVGDTRVVDFVAIFDHFHLGWKKVIGID
jgi:hypothetical protein